MTRDERCLPIPADIDQEPQGEVVELARVWWNNGDPAMVLRAAMNEPRTMGTILGELAWQFAKAYADQHGLDQGMALKDLHAGWMEARIQSEGLLEKGVQ